MSDHSLARIATALETGLGYAVQIRDNQGGLTNMFWVAWDKYEGAPVIEPAWNVNEVID